MGHYSSNVCGFELWERRGFKGNSNSRKAGWWLNFKMLCRDQEIEHGEIDVVPLDKGTEQWHKYNSKVGESRGARKAKERWGGACLERVFSL